MGWNPGHNVWFIALTVTLATFMEVLDTSVANVALPHIAGGLAAGQDESTWVLTSYLVSNAIVLPLSGWLSSIFGRKRFYMSCVALFTVGSFLCGIAPSLPLLILFRVMQGAGGGGLQPSEQAILADTFRPPSAAWRLRSTEWRWWWRRRSDPRLAAGSPTTTVGAGSSSSTFPIGILSLTLTSLLVADPPWLKGRRARRHQGGLHRLRAVGAGTWGIAGASRQGPARRLVFDSLHCGPGNRRGSLPAGRPTSGR